MDDLRDYRFYASDLIHPGDQGVAYVTEIFSKVFFDDKGKQMLKEAEKLYKMTTHRYFDEHSEAARRHMEKIKQFADILRTKYPGLKPMV
jgi:hypothetical protein